MDNKPNEAASPKPAEGAPPQGKFYGNWMLVALVSGAIAFGVMRGIVSLVKGLRTGSTGATAEQRN